MARSQTHVITGGTGLVGSSLILTLAARTDHEFVCLIRPGKGPGKERLEQVLRRTADSFALPSSLVGDTVKRTRVVAADIMDDPSGIGVPSLSGAVEFWHSAALLLFRKKQRDRVFAANVEGTRRMLDLARRVGVEQFNYMSTAMVAPSDRTGVVSEEPVLVPVPRNPYEESKVEAERTVREQSDFPARILRPSIVVGHSETLGLPAEPSGPYLIQMAFEAFLRQTATEGRAARRRVLAMPDEECNLVPVDHVARDAVGVSLHGPREGVFHLTNPTPPTTGDVLGAFAANCGMPELEFTQDPGLLDEKDLLLQRMVGVYNPYINQAQSFDRSRTDMAAPGGEVWDPDMETLRKLFSAGLS